MAAKVLKHLGLDGYSLTQVRISSKVKGPEGNDSWATIDITGHQKFYLTIHVEALDSPMLSEYIAHECVHLLTIPFKKAILRNPQRGRYQYEEQICDKWARDIVKILEL